MATMILPPCRSGGRDPSDSFDGGNCGSARSVGRRELKNVKLLWLAAKTRCQLAEKAAKPNL
jgi:hypothetical protein